MMEVLDNKEKERILSNVFGLINIAKYYELHELTFEEFIDKYGHHGDEIHNRLEIRFYNDTNVLLQVKKLLLPGEQYYFLPIISKERRIYKDDMSFLDSFYTDVTETSHILVIDNAFQWVLLKDNFNKLIAIGELIKKRIKRMIHLKFDNENLMYVLGE